MTTLGMTRPLTSSSGAPQIHLRIRRLSIDDAVAGAATIDPADFQSSLQSAIAERLEAGADDSRQAAPERSTSISDTVANAVAAHVRPFLGHKERA